MNLVFAFLIWFVVDASGMDHVYIQPEATLEQCEADADMYVDQSESDIKTKDITDYYGLCLPVDSKDIIERLGMDARGSI